MGVSVKRIVVTGWDCQPAGLRRTARLAVAAGRKVRITRLSEQLVADIPAKWPASAVH